MSKNCTGSIVPAKWRKGSVYANPAATKLTRKTRKRDGTSEVSGDGRKSGKEKRRLRVVVVVDCSEGTFDFKRIMRSMASVSVIVSKRSGDPTFH